jgi:3-deoxy-7-phosphoheptulonate synthase
MKDSVKSSWNPDSWRAYPAEQQPTWPDTENLTDVLNKLSTFPPLVFAGEVRTLKERLASVARGDDFLLQGGDCAESFDQFNANIIRDNLKVILQMAAILTYGLSRPVVKVGRIAGQFAKPRSNPIETRNGISLPSFRGYSVNDPNFSAQARAPDPERLVRAYFHSAAMLNLLRAFTRGGFADLNKVHVWNQDFVANSPNGKRYGILAEKISDALRFMKVCGIDSSNTPVLKEVEYYTSHEALTLDYEQALTRRDSLTGDFFCCSAHFLWIGERTRQTDGAHVEFLRGVKNPLGCKIGPTATEDDLLRICDSLNPSNEPGRLTLITRFGNDVIEKRLPPLIRAIEREGRVVAWCCDPMHGNTFTSSSGYKTRFFDNILSELRSFFAIHAAEGTISGGVHFELTGEDVTECTGGARDIRDCDLDSRYKTSCDPRLNNEQALEMAFLIVEMVHRHSARRA